MHPLIVLVSRAAVLVAIVLGPPSQVGGLQYLRTSYPSLSICNRGEGWVKAMVHPEVDYLGGDIDPTCNSTNPHGSKPPRWGTFKRLRPHEKRSYKRARNRALRDGYAWHNGRLFDRKHFIGHPLTEAIPPEPKSCPPSVRPSCATRNRVHMMAWNGTGLAGWKIDELRAWLHQQMIQVVVLLETRWQFDREWTEDGWHHIASSGSPFRSCGIPIMIRSTLCSSDRISWQTPIPGRIVHVRLHLNRPLDIVGCYQHTFVNTRPCKSNRSMWIKTLNDLLNDLPRRNSLVVLGDWNCGLPQTHPHIGTHGVMTQDPLAALPKETCRELTFSSLGLGRLTVWPWSRCQLNPLIS